MKEPRYIYCFLWPFLLLSEPDTIAFASVYFLVLRLLMKSLIKILWSTKFRITCFRRWIKSHNCVAKTSSSGLLHMILFILSVVLKFEFVDEIL